MPSRAMEGDQPGVQRSLTLEEFLEEDWSSSGSPKLPGRARGGALAVPSTWDLAPPPLPPTPHLSEDDTCSPGTISAALPSKMPGREAASPDTTEAPSQVPTLNALEAEEISTLSDACLLDDRIGLTCAVKKLAHELRRVSIGRREHAVLRKEEMEAEEARRARLRSVPDVPATKPGPSQSERCCHEPVTATATEAQEQRIQEKSKALASTLQNLFAAPSNLPPEMKDFPRRVAQAIQTPEKRSADLDASAVAMAEKMLDLEGKLGPSSNWVHQLQLALLRQREQEAELEKELHLSTLQLRSLTQDLAEAKLRRQELEEEQAQFVPFATQELEHAVRQLAHNRRAPESLRRLVASETPRRAASAPRIRRKRVSPPRPSQRSQRAPYPTFGRIVL